MEVEEVDAGYMAAGEDEPECGQDEPPMDINIDPIGAVPVEPYSRRPTVEDVDDDDTQDWPSPGEKYAEWIQDFPDEYEAGVGIGEGETEFERIRREAGEHRWAGFEDQDDWELGKWMVRNLGQNEMETLLKLEKVRNVVSFHIVFCRTCSNIHYLTSRFAVASHRTPTRGVSLGRSTRCLPAAPRGIVTNSWLLATCSMMMGTQFSRNLSCIDAILLNASRTFLGIRCSRK